MKMKNKEMD